MENNNTALQIMNPGGFDKLTKLVNSINAEKADVVPSSPSAHVEVTNDMLTGKKLIGIFANANSIHALLQRAPKLELNFGFKFNNETYNKLNIEEASDGTLISRNLAEWVAAIVDNGKDPLANRVNVNNYTVDVLIGMLLTGVPMRTALEFLSNDIVVAFVDHYRNNGANAQAELKAYKLFNLNKKVIREYDPKNITDTTTPRDVLKSFLFYKEAVKPVSNLIQALKVAENGLGPTDSHTLFYIDQIENESLLWIDGARELVNDTSKIHNALINVLYEGRANIINKAGLPDTNKGTYRAVREYFRNYKTDNLLSVREIDRINSEILTFIASDKFKLNQNLINGMVSRFNRAKKDGKYEYFFNAFFAEGGYLFYKGIDGETEVERTRLSKLWEAMLHDPKYSKLAEDLVTYTFFMSGFNPGTFSFSHLIPISYFVNNTELREWLDNNTKAFEVLDYNVRNEFIFQFVRNNFRRLGLLPVLEPTDINSKFVTEDNQVKYIASSSSDLRGKDGEFVDYMITRTKLQGKKVVADEPRLYMFDTTNSDENQAIYVPVQELGIYKKRGDYHMVGGKVFNQYSFVGNLPKINFPDLSAANEENAKMLAEAEKTILGKIFGTSGNILNDKCNKPKA